MHKRPGELAAAEQFARLVTPLAGKITARAALSWKQNVTCAGSLSGGGRLVKQHPTARAHLAEFERFPQTGDTKTKRQIQPRKVFFSLCLRLKLPV